MVENILELPLIVRQMQRTIYSIELQKSISIITHNNNGDNPNNIPTFFSYVTTFAKHGQFKNTVALYYYICDR
jgi:hypothetical protein